MLLRLSTGPHLLVVHHSPPTASGAYLQFCHTAFPTRIQLSNLSTTLIRLWYQQTRAERGVGRWVPHSGRIED